jgi:hypothetical protein
VQLLDKYSRYKESRKRKTTDSYLLLEVNQILIYFQQSSVSQAIIASSIKQSGQYHFFQVFAGSRVEPKISSRAKSQSKTKQAVIKQNKREGGEPRCEMMHLPTEYPAQALLRGSTLSSHYFPVALLPSSHLTCT